MLNNQLKNSLVPWQEKGRWYKVFIESNGTDFSITTSDIENASITSKGLTLPSNVRVHSVAFGDHDAHAGNMSTTVSFSSSGKPQIGLPTVTATTYIEVWAFCTIE